MKKRIRIKYLELDEFIYIENGVIKSKLSREEANSTFLSWEEDGKK